MSAAVTWRDAIRVSDAAERERILAATSSSASVEEALAEARAHVAQAPPDALTFAELACAMARYVGSPKLKSAAERVRGQTLRALHRHSEAIDALEASAQHAMASGDERLALQSRIGIVDSLSWLERFDEAIELARELGAKLMLQGDLVEAGKVLINEGNLYHRRDEYDAAETAYQRGLDLLRGRVPADVIARVETNLANIFTHKNRVQEAIALYDRARRVFESANDQYSMAVVDLNLGFLHYIAGEHTAAMATFTRSRRAFEAAGRIVEAAKVDGDAADVYRALNLLPEALECYERALDVFRAQGMMYETGRAQIGRAVALSSFERFDEAMEALDEAERIFRKEENHLQTAHVALIRAHVLRSAGKGSEAADQAAIAARDLAAAGLHGWAAEAAFIQHDVSLEAGRDATAGMQRVVAQARDHLRSSLEGRAHQSLGRYYANKGQTEEALAHFRAGVQALEHARTLVSIEEFHVAFLRDKLSIYEDLVATLLGRGRAQDIREALEYVERSKSRLLLERVQSAHDAALRRAGRLDPELAQRLGQLRTELCSHYHGLQFLDGGEQLRKRLSIPVGDLERVLKVEEEYRDALLEAELAAPEIASRRRSLGEVVPVEELQAALDTGETLVEYAVFRDQVAAFVVTPKDVFVRLNVASVEAVEHAARRLRYHLQRVESQSSYVERHASQLHAAIRQVLEELYAYLLQPLENLIHGDKLVIVPHSIVHGLPLHAARDGSEYALDRWEMIYSPGAALWHAGVHRGRRRGTSNGVNLVKEKALLMAYPVPGIELVTEEVLRLSEVFENAVVFTEEAATLEAFAAHAPESGIIHLATHALFRADNPLFSGLQLADGWLFAHDLYEYSMNCHLATLSACRTGAALVEPGDELFGLMRGFLAAGAQSLAVSLWPAADAATMSVMVEFYHNLASGMTRGAALREAQRAVRNEYEHPYYWAAFALVGAR